MKWEAPDMPTLPDIEQAIFCGVPQILSNQVRPRAMHMFPAQALE
jgi:hypothetical protein